MIHLTLIFPTYSSLFVLTSAFQSHDSITSTSSNFCFATSTELFVTIPLQRPLFNLVSISMEFYCLFPMFLEARSLFA